jgi:hypothetical protein
MEEVTAMPHYAEMIPNLREFIHQELVDLGLATEEEIQQAQEKRAQQEATSQDQADGTEPTKSS